MKTIRQLVNETRSMRQTDKELDREDRVDAVYRDFPGLERIDEQIVRVRGQNLIRVAEKKIDAFSLPTEEEKELAEKRRVFIMKNNIDPEFDELKIVCPKCKDEGFISGKYKDGHLYKVCDCMKDELEEAFAQAGLGYYKTINSDTFDTKHIASSAEKRTNVRKILTRALMDFCYGGNAETYIYSDGVQTGKTFLAVWFAKTAIELGCSTFYCKADDVISADDEFISNLKECKVLVIDDFSSRVTAVNKAASILNNVLDIRSSAGLMTVFVTTESKEEIIAESDERVSGKLVGAVKL